MSRRRRLICIPSLPGTAESWIRVRIRLESSIHECTSFDFRVCVSIPLAIPGATISTLFPSDVLGIARRLSQLERNSTIETWIDVHGIFKGRRFRAQVLSRNKTLDTKLDGLPHFSSLPLGLTPLPPPPPLYAFPLSADETLFSAARYFTAAV